MDKIHAPPQPGSPERAHRLLPLGWLSASLLLGAVFCVAATIGFLWLAGAVLTDRFASIDDGVITWAHTYWGPWQDQVMLFFTTMGDTLTLSLIVGAVALALLRRDRWIDAAGLVVAGVGAGIINQALKAVYQRQLPKRPLDGLDRLLWHAGVPRRPPAAAADA
jgi:hypothetical protein